MNALITLARRMADPLLPYSTRGVEHVKEWAMEYTYGYVAAESCIAYATSFERSCYAITENTFYLKLLRLVSNNSASVLRDVLETAISPAM